MVKICHASISENGDAGRDGKAKAGDQTHREVCCRPYYNKGWKMLLRYPDERVANEAANCAMLLADSDLVGYDQTQRNTLFNALREVNYVVDTYLISELKTETDCSAFVTAAYVCAGIKQLIYTTNAPTTSTMERVFKNVGFNVLKDKKYLTSDEYLRKGDILLIPGSHVVLVCESGTRAFEKPNRAEYYPKYNGNSGSIVNALSVVGEQDTSKSHRAKIAVANNVVSKASEYTGSAEQNMKLYALIKDGYLIKA